MRELTAVRRPLIAATASLIAYLIVIVTARFIVSTGVSPVIPAGVALVAAIAALRLLKRTVASLISEKKARRQVVQNN